jgi:DNA helicase-2/ATP-dependent DNA helicase PcrA
MKAGRGVKGLSDVKPKLRHPKPFEKLKQALAELDGDRLPVAEMGARLLSYYASILEEKYDDHPKRAKDLEHLLVIMERYSTLEQFLSDMALEPPNASVNGILAPDYEDEQLVLSTIHSAKGLEWHTVFIIWVLEGRFPATYAVRSEEEMEEELRLMYVAATRAKENLYFTYPINVFDRTMGTIFARLSRFIDGIPEDILEPWSLVGQDEHDWG